MATIKERIAARLEDVRTGMNSLRSSKLGNAYFWQEVGALADKGAKAAWAEMQTGKDSFVLDDDSMRALGEGEHVVERTKLFCVSAKIAAPRKNFDLDSFIAAASKKFKIDAAKLTALADAHKVSGKPSLTKRVLEL